jgi:NAD-dependent dihydropyrimidine dehydrogenase PreA subunit
MEKAAKFRERAQRFEERAATEIDPEAREQWQRVADAWHSAAEAAARTPPLIWEWPLAVTTVTRLEALPHISTVGNFGAGRLVIRPDECTDCGVCEPARAS